MTGRARGGGKWAADHRDNAARARWFLRFPQKKRLKKLKKNYFIASRGQPRPIVRRNRAADQLPRPCDHRTQKRSLFARAAWNRTAGGTFIKGGKWLGRGHVYPIGHTGIADQTPMRPHSRYFIGGLGMAIAMSSFVVALEIPAVSRGPNGPDPGTVSRGLKGDRLPLIPGPSGARPVDDPRAHEPKLPE